MHMTEAWTKKMTHGIMLTLLTENFGMQKGYYVTESKMATWKSRLNGKTLTNHHPGLTFIVWYFKTQPRVKHLLNQKPFPTLANYCIGGALSNLVKAYKAKVLLQGKRYKFGIRVPFGIKQAMMLDKENGNTLWFNIIKNSSAQVNGFFQDPGERGGSSQGLQANSIPHSV